MAGSARNSTSTLAASAALGGPSPAGQLGRAARPPLRGMKSPVHAATSASAEIKGRQFYPVRRHKPHHSRTTLPPAISSPRCRCLQEEEHTRSLARSQPNAPACFPRRCRRLSGPRRGTRVEERRRRTELRCEVRCFFLLALHDSDRGFISRNQFEPKLFPIGCRIAVPSN